MNRITIFAVFLLSPGLCFAQFLGGAKGALRQSIKKEVQQFALSPEAEKLVLNSSKKLTLEQLTAGNKQLNNPRLLNEVLGAQIQNELLKRDILPDSYHRRAATHGNKHFRTDEDSSPLEVRNNLTDLLYTAEYAARLEFVKRHASQLRGSLVTTLNKEIDYTQLIDPQATLVYVGEHHDEFRVIEAVEELFRQYHTAYPGRKMIVLTEFADISIVGPKAVLDNFHRRDGAVLFYAGVFERLAKQDIFVVGLDDFKAVRSVPAGSRVFVQRRNEQWAQIIRQWREKEPNALFFVYAGAGHTKYSSYNHMASLLPEEKGQVFTFLPAKNLNKQGTFWDYLYPAQGPALWNEFYQDSRNKVVMTLEDMRYRKLVGADVTVVVHNRVLPYTAPPFRAVPPSR